MTGADDPGWLTGTTREGAQPLSLVAIGMLVVLLDVNAGAIDLLPDVLGWVVVAIGLLPLRQRHAGFAVAAYGAIAFVPLSLLLFAQDDLFTGAFGRAVTSCEHVMQAAVEISALLAVRALTQRASTRSIATIVMAVDLIVSAAAALAALLLPETQRTVDGPFAVLFVAALIAFVVSVVAVLLWLYRVGREEAFRR